MTEYNNNLTFPYKEVEEMKEDYPNKEDLLDIIEYNVIASLEYLSSESDVRQEEPLEMLSVSLAALIDYIREEL